MTNLCLLILSCNSNNKFKIFKYKIKIYLLQVLAGCGVYDGSEVHEASAWVLKIELISIKIYNLNLLKLTI